MKLSWDDLGTKTFESGCDKGVLYSPRYALKGFPWNGLVSINESVENRSVIPLYYDGEKSIDLVKYGNFSGSIKAIMYPDEFLEFDGFDEYTDGIFLGNQPISTFGLSYRNLTGTDLNPENGYKIHILYNLTAVPDTVVRQTITSNVDGTVEFVWNITSKPEKFPGRRPTAHIVIDSRAVSEEVLSALEDILYGTDETDARLPTIDELVELSSVVITDDGDGEWSAEGPDYLVDMVDDDYFHIEGAPVTYLDEYTYEIASTGE